MSTLFQNVEPAIKLANRAQALCELHELLTCSIATSCLTGLLYSSECITSDLW